MVRVAIIDEHGELVDVENLRFEGIHKALCDAQALVSELQEREDHFYKDPKEGFRRLREHHESIGSPLDGLDATDI